MGKINTAFDHIKDVKSVTELSIVLYEDSFFYGLWSDQEALLKTDNHSISNLSKVLNILRRNFRIRKTRIMSTVKPYAHISNGDYEKKYFDDYFDGLYDISLRPKVKKSRDKFLREKIHTLHYLDKKVLKELQSQDISHKTAHISTALANYTYLADTDLVGFISGKQLHVCYASEGKFQFYNQFYCETAEDYLYYLLWVMDYFDMNATEQKIHIGGSITKYSKLYDLLQSYIRKVKLIDKNIIITKDNDVPKQLYYDLFLCKSCV